MATEGKPVTDFPEYDYKDWEGSNKREAAWWEAAKAAGRRFIKFPIADGYAVYEVRGTKRYTLHHVPEGDAWRVPTYQIRGLRKADIDRQIEAEARMAKLFSRAG